MKFRISMKTPDALDYAIEDALSNGFSDGDEPAIDDAMSDRKEELKELCERWFSHGEAVTIEIDTEAKTATVLPARK